MVMSWTPTDAETLLHAAFPWSAHVTVEGGSKFVSARYAVLEENFGVAEALLRFERDPGDTVQRVRRSQLEHAVNTGILELDSGASVCQPEVTDMPLLASPFRDLIGYQPTIEHGWIARMRLHQSWWRAFRLRVPYGTGPTRSSKTRYGNMLDDDGAARGLNFLTDEACAAYDERVAVTPVGVDEWRTRRNLLASQPMAFNLFGHLSKHLGLATGLFQRLLSNGEVSAVTSIEIERLSDALGDRTAFDAFVTYRRPDGAHACVVVETKLTEPFSQQSYDWTRYVAHTAFDATVWTTAEPNVLGDGRWSQLWRNHLLARAESAACDGLGPATLLVVHHPLDPHCRRNVDAYRALLHEPTEVRAVDLLAIRDVLGDLVVGDDNQEKWLADFSDRYLDLRLSDALRGIEDTAPAGA
jgi:hypothetical protein